MGENSIPDLIYWLRDQRVMLGPDLAGLYGVKPKALYQAVRRNSERFPRDFMFQLTWEETKRVQSGLILRSQIVTLKPSEAGKHGENAEKGIKNPRSQFVTLDSGANLKYRPFAFTEQGVGQLSCVLRSPQAVRTSIEIQRAFVRLRRVLAENRDLARKLEALERRYDGQFAEVFAAIRALMDPETRGREIGFKSRGRK